MLTKSQVIKRFLSDKPLGHLYDEGMEVHCNVLKGIGEEIKKGVFSDGNDNWYHVRIADSKYEHTNLGFEFNKHIEGIGLTGWDFKNKISRWVGFDFDSIIGHKEGLSEQQINEILEKTKTITWASIRKSKSGQGIHIIVPIAESPVVDSRKMHIQLAKYVLSQLSAILCFDYKSKVDTCGTVLWIWHRNTKSGGLDTIKEATECYRNFPPGWEKSFQTDTKTKQIVADLRFSGLDDEHQRLLNYLFNKGHGWWNAELNMLVCHTAMLKQAHTELVMKGVFFTNAEGRNLPNDWNCFCFPLQSGGWICRRYGKPKEHTYWKLDKNETLFCYFNRTPFLSDISPIYDGKRNSNGQWVFNDSTAANQVLRILSLNGSVSFPDWAINRQVYLKPLRDRHLAVVFERTNVDPDSAHGWIKRKTTWEQVVEIHEEERNIKPPDEMVRHVVSEGQEAGWFVKSGDQWVGQQLPNVKMAMLSLGYKGKDIDEILGQCVLSPWQLINKPFGDEYPGNRKWNKYSPQFMFIPKEGTFPHWQLILDHLGQSLTVDNNKWCVEHEIRTGGQYLLLWVAALFQYPYQPLPYIFFHGPQNSGKSIFYESIQLLVNKGVVRAENALTSQSRFNEELAGSILAVTDEFDLTKNKQAYDRIKDWVTAKTITIRPMFRAPFSFPNTTHWIQIANNASYCPVQLGDTRIVMCHVPLPEKEIPKAELMDFLMEEAPSFLYHILNVTIPKAIGRLRIPVIDSADKVEYAKTNEVEQFIMAKMVPCSGELILFSDFCNRFRAWLDNSARPSVQWTNITIGKSITESDNMPVKGRAGGDGNIYLGNFKYEDSVETEKGFKWVKVGERLVKR